MAKLTTTDKLTDQPLFRRLKMPVYLWTDVLLLAIGLAGAWLPAGWTRDLKRIQQPNWYIGFGFIYILIFALVSWVVLRRFPPHPSPLPQGEREQLTFQSHLPPTTYHLPYPNRQSSIAASPSLGVNRQSYNTRWLGLLLLVLLPNILNIWVRYSFELAPGQPLFGRDADVGLFFVYGHAANMGEIPTFQGHYMEYPQLALLLFQIGDMLAGGDQPSFYWIFPAFMLVFQLMAAAALYGIGLKVGQARAGYLLAVFGATCPFLYLFNYTRFDIAPAALLLVAVYFFLPSPSKENLRNVRLLNSWQAVISGLLVAAGSLTKWLPAVIAPWLALAYLQAKRWRDLALFVGSGLFLGVVILVPSYLANAEAFWYPYKFQGERRMIGESFWYLIQYFWLDSARIIPDRPWGEPSVIKLGNRTLLIFQLALTFLVLLLTFLKLSLRSLRSLRLNLSNSALLYYPHWAASGLIGVAVFTLGNRIFSPQYMVLLVWAWLGALLLRPVGWRSVILAVATITVSAGANFLVFLLGAFPDEWIRYSVILFLTAWGLCGWLLWRAVAITSPQRHRE